MDGTASKFRATENAGDRYLPRPRALRLALSGKGGPRGPHRRL